MALQTVALQRQRRLPKLSSLLVKYPRTRSQTVEEQKRIVRMMVETFKGNT